MSPALEPEAGVPRDGVAPRARIGRDPPQGMLVQGLPAALGTLFGLAAVDAGVGGAPKRRAHLGGGALPCCHLRWHPERVSLSLRQRRRPHTERISEGLRRPRRNAPDRI